MFSSLSSATAQLEALRLADSEKKEIIARLEDHVTRLTRGKKATSEDDDDDMTTDELLATSLLDHQQHHRAAVGSQSMVDIVKAQRDRLKERLSELEELLSAEKMESVRLRTEGDKLREDNTKLYGKIRFLQSHRSNASSSVAIDNDVDVYKQQWEQKMSPFARFTNQETIRHQQRLPIHDKATLSIARAVFSNGAARFTFFCYLLVLHLLVFIVLYYNAWASTASRDDCIDRFAEHMKEHHHG